MQIPKTQTQGTGNLAIFNSLDEDVLLSYSSSLNADDVMAVIGGKQNGVKVDISKRTSSTVMVFGFKMPAVKDYLKADCDETKMPTAFVQSEFIPTAESSFVLEASEVKQDYGTLLIFNKRSGLVSIFQGSSRNKQIGVVQAGQSNYRIQIPIGYKQLVFYLHNPSGGIDFTKPVFSKNLVFNKGDTKLVFIPNKTIFNGAKIKFLNASAQDVMLMVRKSDSPLSNIECSCEVVGKQSDKPVMILVQDKYYADDFFFSVINAETGETLTESQPFQLDKKTNASFKLQTDLTLKKTDVGKGQVVVPNEKPSTPSEVKTSEVKASSVKVSWSPSADSDGEVAGYEVSYKTSSGSWTGTQTTTQTSLIVSGLQPETSYTFRVRAKDDEGDWSAYEESQPVKTPEAANQPPSKPSTISTSQVTASSIKVSWSAATDSDGSIAGYEISYKSGNNVFWTGISTTASTTYSFNQLQPATSYTFRVRAKDDDGDWSPYQTSTAVSTAPNAPTALAVSARSLTFMMTSGSSYECSKDAGTTKTNCNSPFSFGDDAIAKDKLCVRVKASGNTPASDWSCYSQAINQPPSKPSNISTSQVTGSSITVSWTASTDSDGSIAGYEVSYKEESGTWTGTQTTTQTTYTFSNLTWVTSYTFRVKSKDNDGEYSSYTTSSSVKTKSDKTFGGSDRDGANSIIQTSDGGYVVAGYTKSKGAGDRDWHIIKLNSTGNQVWDKTFGGSHDDYANSIIQTSDGGYVVVGIKTLSNGSSWYNSSWIIKLNSSGNQVWDKIFRSSTFWSLGGNVYTYSVVQTSDSGYVLGVNRNLIKLNSNGNKVWDKPFHRSRLDTASSIIQTSDGRYVVAGYTLTGNSYNVYIANLSSSGRLRWHRNFGGSNDDGADSIIQTSDGGYVVAGYTKSKGAGDSDAWIIKLNSNGNKVWDKTFGGSDRDGANSIIQTSDGGYVVAGYTKSKGAGDSDVWLIKLDANGN